MSLLRLSSIVSKYIPIREQESTQFKYIPL